MFPLNSWTPYSGTVVSLGPCSHVSSHPCCHTQDNVSAGRPRRSPSSHASGVLVIERSASGPLDYHTCWQITIELEHHPKTSTQSSSCKSTSPSFPSSNLSHTLYPDRYFISVMRGTILITPKVQSSAVVSAARPRANLPSALPCAART